MKIEWRGLICDGDRVSIGRVSFWILLVIMCFMWLNTWEIPDSLFWTWSTIVGYNTLSKPLDMTAEYLNLKKIKKEMASLEKFFKDN